jgi:recombination protein RecR
VLPARVDRLIALLSRLPGVGEKTAQRYVLFLLTADPHLSQDMGAEIGTLRDHLVPCALCGNIAEIEQRPEGGDALCGICKDSKRDTSLLCVVARVHDLFAIERAGAMRGRYFVLGKLLSPLEGIGPDELPIDKLVHRIKAEGVRELIVATPPSVDGEATALLLKQELAALPVKVTRIASGVPHGGDLEFADPITMGRALAGRQQL